MSSNNREWADICTKGLLRLAEERRELMRLAFKVKERREASEVEARQGPSCFPAVMQRERGKEGLGVGEQAPRVFAN